MTKSCFAKKVNIFSTYDFSTKVSFWDKGHHICEIWDFNGNPFTVTMVMSLFQEALHMWTGRWAHHHKKLFSLSLQISCDQILEK